MKMLCFKYHQNRAINEEFDFFFWGGGGGVCIFLIGTEPIFLHDKKYMQKVEVGKNDNMSPHFIKWGDKSPRLFPPSDAPGYMIVDSKCIVTSERSERVRFSCILSNFLGLAC